ncbi:ABC transporter permease [Aquimarina gracilis]|uniref:ABC transporter permease n=1 Tax=Aquimarina gracilis TaxID=874422 RepID=A0ABU5ZZ79_9FLAO|nr:ABC transporter permease [Aquimarina gracilis]MEB3347215.1 ABC transporter permease [Aquimarina gracilis]
MFNNHIKIAWRTLLKHKGLFAINILGLSIGIAAALIIFLFVSDELSYDRFHEKSDQIVRVVLKGKMNGELIKEAVTPGPVAQTLQEEFPEVLQATRLKSQGTPQITYKNQTFRDNKFAYVDPNFFEVFTVPFIKGDSKTALKEPNTIIITQELATKYFGREDPIGKILDFKEWKQQFKVTGVMQKLPSNSHFHFDVLGSMNGFAHAKETRWIESGYHSYLLLDKRGGFKETESKLPGIVKKYMGPQIKKSMGMTFEEFSKNNEIGLFLQPLTDIHLRSDFADVSNLEPGGDVKTIYIFGAIAIFILLIACINFMNLSTAAASKRAKEVGVKKVLGSSKKGLIKQFLAESFIATLIAMAIAIITVIIALPLFNTLSGKTLDISYILNPRILFCFGLTGLFISLLAGSYPAFFLSSFRPITALKSKFVNTGKTKGLRSGLVVFQFVLSVALIIATLVVDQQMAYIQNKDIGYQKDQMLVLRDSWMLGTNEEAFKEQLSKDPRVSNVTMSGHIPAGPSYTHMTSIYPGQNSEAIRRSIVYNIDEQYIPTMGMKLVAGRNFSKDFGSESNTMIINETSAKIMGFGNDAVGKTVTMAINNEGGIRVYTVIGVVQDFHFTSLHEPIDQLIMLNDKSSGLIVRAKTADMAGLIASAKSLWNGFNSGEPFSYGLLDELYNQTYIKEQKMGTILRIFALLTIFVACLGLFGLITFTAEQRFKEIGIRKVLGSSIPQIVAMLSADFLKLVVISFLIAFPLGFYFMNTWLQDFAYRIQIEWWIFALSGVITLLIAFTTIGWKSFKAASMNPVNSLRAE